MKTKLVNIKAEIANALRKQNGAIGWRVRAEMVTGGFVRVQPNRSTDD
jgi:hypothetical protein